MRECTANHFKRKEFNVDAGWDTLAQDKKQNEKSNEKTFAKASFTCMDDNGRT